MKKFVILTALIVLTRAGDIYTTYLSTPDLKYEFNPLVSTLGIGWAGLIFTQIIFLSFLIYALWVYCFKNVETPAVEKGLPMRAFASLFYFNNTSSFTKIFYKLPTNKNSFLYSIAYIVIYTLIVISIIISSSTFLLVKNKAYKDFYNSHKLWTYIYTLGIALLIYYSVKFFKHEYERRSVSYQNTVS